MSVVSCTIKPYEESTDMQRRNLKGNVCLVIEQTVRIEDDKEIEEPISILKFNRYGNLLSDSRERTKYTYDGNGNLLVKRKEDYTYFMGEGLKAMYTYWKYEYDKNYFVTKIKEYEEYDSDNKILSSCQIFARDKYHYVTKSITISKNGHQYTYDIAYRLLNSVDFGVAQSRERLIYIAVRNDVSFSKRITAENIFEEINKICQSRKKVNLQSALEFIPPLEAPRMKGMTEIDSVQTGMKIGPNNYDSCGNEYLRVINGGRHIPFIFNHKARYCSDINYEIFKRLSPGEDSTSPKIADIMPYAHRNGVFKDKYYKLYADRPCRTITAHLRMDCLSHIHPTQIRSLTPREAARVQSFPDDYLFLGAYLKTYMQIGNAVPVLMAKQIATIIKKYI